MKKQLKPIEQLPEKLREIHATVQKYYITQHLFDLDQRKRIDSFLNRKHTRLPFSKMENNGEAHYLGSLSPGCQACKKGRWECIFVTMECNTDCDFCWRPTHPSPTHSGSIFGNRPQSVAAKLKANSPAGISFSGGEPFLAPDTLMAWIRGIIPQFANQAKKPYFWIYTNGLLAQKETLKSVAALGIDEIRFNLAATGYNHHRVMKNVTDAVRIFPAVTVEIPAIPEHRERVLKNLYIWADLGVRHLNLHELIYEPGTKSEVMEGCRLPLNNPDGHVCHFNPESRDLTLAVMEEVYNNNIPINVNDCSLFSKQRQIRGRRHFLSGKMKKPHEEWVDGALASVCAFKKDSIKYFKPSEINVVKAKYTDYHFCQMSRMGPLSSTAPEQWIQFEVL